MVKAVYTSVSYNAESKNRILTHLTTAPNHSKASVRLLRVVLFLAFCWPGSLDTSTQTDTILPGLQGVHEHERQKGPNSRSLAWSGKQA